MIVRRVSSRIIIKKLSVEDAPTVYKLIDQSREQLQNLQWTQSATLESVVEFIKSKECSADQLYGIYHSKTFAGCIEIRRKEWYHELGYWLGFDFRGYGIMHLVTKYLVDNLINNTDYPICAKVKRENKSSLSILHNAGLNIVGSDETWNYLLRAKDGI